MSIETLLEENTTAANRLADLLEKQGGATGGKPAGKPAASGKPAGKPKTTFDEVKAAVIDVKDRIDEPSAKAILEKHAGKGAKLAAIANKPETWDKIMAACEAAVAALDDEPPAEEDDGI